MTGSTTPLILEPGHYARAREAWQRDPTAFWHAAARDLSWAEAPETGLSLSPALQHHWFPDGRLNACYNAVDRHVLAGRGAHPALKWRGQSEPDRVLSYGELQHEVARLAGALRAQGVQPGDRVMIYMPQIPETVVAMLAAARLGAVHVVIFGGFSAVELARRVDHCRPRVLLAGEFADLPTGRLAYFPAVTEAMRLAGETAPVCIGLRRPGGSAEGVPGGWLDWQTCVAAAEPVDCVPMRSNDPLYVLYTSGTSGTPKGVVHDIGGTLVGLSWAGRSIYGMAPRMTFWAASDLGWAAAHTCSVWAPLVCGAASVVFEGKPVGTPDASAYWRVVRDFGVEAMFCAPTAIRAMISDMPLETLRATLGPLPLARLHLAGELLDSAVFDWLRAFMPGVPLLNHWWQTETAWPIASMLLEDAASQTFSPAVGMPMPGYDLALLDHRFDVSVEDGMLAVRLPMPPGFMTGLWQDASDQYGRYFSAGGDWYLTFDAGAMQGNGSVSVLGRTDDVINVSGHRLATGDIEKAIVETGLVKGCVVVGRRDALKGEVPIAVVLMAQAEGDDAEIARQIKAAVRRRIGPVAALDRVVIASELPVTRSGKVLRRTIRELANGAEPKVPETIENPSCLAGLRDALSRSSPG